MAQQRILDTPPESALDDLTALAGHLCEAPVALISFVDEHREWFKAAVGLTRAEVPRERSFGDHAIRSSAPLIIPDAPSDDRFRNNPLVAGEAAIRFYAAAPLVTREGFALGTLSVMDRKPRRLTASQLAGLEVLARQVVNQLDLRRRLLERGESQSMLLKVFQSCPAALSIARWRDRTFVDVNPAFTSLLGWSDADVFGRTSFDLKLVEEPTAAATLRSRLEGEQAFRNEELRIRTKHGAVLQMLVGSELIDLSGERHVVSTYVDITERKQSELASVRLAAIVESSDDAIIGKDLNGVITSWNAGAARLFGFSSEEMLGASIMRLIPAGREEEERSILAHVARGERVSHLETQRLTRDGRLIDVSVTSSPIRDAAGVVVGASKIARDITERLRAETLIRESEARYRALFDYAPDGIVIADKDGVYTDVNASLARMLGYERNELIGRSASDIVAPSETVHIRAAITAITSNAEYHRAWEFRRKDGARVIADVIGTMMPDGHIVGMIRDMTERRRVEARFRRLIESNVQGVIFWSTSGQITAANDAFLRIVGRSSDDVVKGRMDLFAITPEELRPGERAAREHIAASGVCAPYETQLVRPDGTRVSVLVGSATFDDTPDEGVSFVLDLTERKRLEDQLLQSQKLQALGTLAAGIAHDFNNLLTVTIGNATLLAEEVPDADELQRGLSQIRAAGLRGAELVRRILTFSRQDEPERRIVDLRTVIEESLKMLRPMVPAQIELRATFDRDTPAVMADPAQINQIVLNLGTNAAHAMRNGSGILSFEVRPVSVDALLAHQSPELHEGTYAAVAVTDTGSGMPPEVLQRVFEPFFTTKPRGAGTGLGLAVAHGIMKSHGGAITVYSERGRGTTFHLYFPATASEAAASPVTKREVQRGTGQHILYVDDEAAMAELMTLHLERLGYRVTTANDGLEAAALFESDPARFDIVVTDLSMPRMTGIELTERLRAANPNTPVIITSGYFHPSDVERAKAAGARELIVKPNTVEELGAALHRMLAQR